VRSSRSEEGSARTGTESRDRKATGRRRGKNESPQRDNINIGADLQSAAQRQAASAPDNQQQYGG